MFYAADCWRIHVAVGEQHYIIVIRLDRVVRAAASARGSPNNCAAARRYLRQLASKMRPPQPPKINVIHAFVCEQQAAPPKTQENNKYSTQFVVGFNYLYYFWASDPSKYDVNRIAVAVNVENLHSDGNKRMSPVGSLPRSDW